MEFFTILLSSLLGLVSPTGLVVDRLAESALRSQLTKAEKLQVRVDNAPSYQLLQGRVKRVQIAGRGLQLKRQDFRIDTLELETDGIDVNPRHLQRGRIELNQPFQAGMRLVLTQQDINQALRSPAVTESLQDLDIELEAKPFGYSDEEDSEQSYKLANPRVELLANNRLRLVVELQEEDGNDMQPLVIAVESGLSVVAGRQLQLVAPVVSANRETVVDELLKEIATGISRQLDLRVLEKDGLRARILQLEVNPQKLEMAAFLQVEPTSRLLQKRR